MKPIIRILTATMMFAVLVFPLQCLAAKEDAAANLQKENRHITQALQYEEKGNVKAAEKEFNTFSTNWLSIEDGIKAKSVTAYHDVEDAMGQVQFALVQQPVKKANFISGLSQLNAVNEKFINGKYPVESAQTAPASADKQDVASVLQLLDQSMAKLKRNDVPGAKADIEKFRKSWLNVEGVVLTQSSKVYADAERDMVLSDAMLSNNPPDIKGAEKTIQGMHDYLAPMAMKTSYNMMDATTILLREGLEALLVVVALLGFLKKAGHEDKKKWVWTGVGSGVGVSIIIGIIVNLLFSAGAFGSNNFLIAGWTGVFAAAMLLYMSYWLHSKSSLAEWQRYIRSKSTKALNTGSLFSLALLSFLAVFREGTETVLFFIGMANSIALPSLLAGIGLGVLVLIIVSYLILKVGVKVPMRPFFLVSSVLMFYLCFKFAGMGIHGLQLAGLLPVNQVEGLPTIDFLAFYPNVQSIIPQAVLLIIAVTVAIWNRRKNIKLKLQLKQQGDIQNVS